MRSRRFGSAAEAGSAGGAGENAAGGLDSFEPLSPEPGAFEPRSGGVSIAARADSTKRPSSASGTALGVSSSSIHRLRARAARGFSCPGRQAWARSPTTPVTHAEFFHAPTSVLGGRPCWSLTAG